MGVNDKVRNDIDLHKGFNLGMRVYANERSYYKVGVGQIWKQYLKQLKQYAHLWKLKNLNIVLTRTLMWTRMLTDTDVNNWVTI